MRNLETGVINLFDGEVVSQSHNGTHIGESLADIRL